jgi:hypothetical protein
MAAFPAARLHPFPGGANRNFPCLTINAVHLFGQFLGFYINRKQKILQKN